MKSCLSVVLTEEIGGWSSVYNGCEEVSVASGGRQTERFGNERVMKTAESAQHKARDQASATDKAAVKACS